MNSHLPPRNIVSNEPYNDSSALSNEDYLMILSKLNEFTDNTVIFGENLLKKMEETRLNEKLKETADVIAKKSEEIKTSLFKRTRESISQIN